MRVPKALLVAMTGVVALALFFALASDHGDGPSPAVDEGKRIVVPYLESDASTNEDHAAELRAPLADPGAQGLAIHVVTDVDTPVPDCSLRAASGKSIIWEASTDEAGNSFLPPSLLGAHRRITILAHSDGFARVSEFLASPYCGALTIRMSKGRAIRGRVLTEAGTTPPCPVRVFALPGALAPPRVAIEQAYNGVPAIPSVLAKSDGSFRIDCVPTGRTIALGAGSLGWTTKNLVVRDEQDSAPVDLTVWRVVACGVSFREIGGALPHSCRHTCRTTWPNKPGNFDLLGRIDEFLSRVSLPKPDWRDVILAYKTGVPDRAPNTVVGSLAVAGYEATSFEVPLCGVTADIPSRTVYLKRTARGFGSLLLTLKGHNLLTADSRRKRGVHPASLVLRASDKTVLRLPVKSLASRIMRFDDIPFGEYEASLLTARGTVRLPDRPLRLSIGPDERRVVIDTRSLASCQFDLRDDRGRALPDLGVLVANLKRREGAPSSLRLLLFHAPYRVEGVPPGTYDIKLAKGVSGAHPLTLSVSMAAGAHREPIVIPSSWRR